jgi:cytochrome P450
LRDEPVSKVRLWDGSEAWLVTRYADGRVILGDDRFSADPRRPGYPEKSPVYSSTIGQDRNIRVLDNPEHDAQKRMLVRDFTVKRVNEIRPHVQAIVDKLIDDMLESGPPSEFISQFATPVPTVLICELLGVPYEERSFFGHRTKALLSAPTVAARARR